MLEPTAPPPSYHIRSADLPLSAFEHRLHHVDRANHRYQISLGDSTGLTKTATSTTLHWHSYDDEWMYVLVADAGATLLVWEPSVSGSGSESGGVRKEEVVSREEPLKAGDFLGFKAGVVRAHALRAGTSEMVYLVGGSRVPLEVSHFPSAGVRQVTDSEGNGGSWKAKDEDVWVSGKTAPKGVERG
ncbi:hypothetical protein C8Q80DRAFT_1121841 [Daedaleopsis nitida]|nr:hypothetical protein C8Q80DRAFT_1121841 [Daedaleopsis nitida]